MASKTFFSAGTFEISHPTALAIYCSDGRFTEPIEELLRSLGHARLDTLTMPGGPGLLNMLSNGFVDFDATKRAASFLIEGHHIRDVVLIAHHSCGYYKTKIPFPRGEEIVETQIRDLKVGATTLQSAHPGLNVMLFYAQPNAGKVRFIQVEL